MANTIAIEGMPVSAAGRVGLCQHAIQKALDTGFSKKEIAQALGLSYMTFFRAWKAQKIVVPEDRQLPLPVAPVVVKPAQATVVVPGAKADAAQSNAKPKRPLPGQTIPVGDAEAMVDAVEAKLGTNFFK